MYFPKRVTTPTWHELALKRAVISPRGDHTCNEKIRAGTEASSSILISAVLVPVQPSHRLVVAFGDSIVDGDGSTIDTDHNWPSDLVRRFFSREGKVLQNLNSPVRFRPAPPTPFSDECSSAILC